MGAYARKGWYFYEQTYLSKRRGASRIYFNLNYETRSYKYLQRDGFSIKGYYWIME